MGYIRSQSGVMWVQISKEIFGVKLRAHNAGALANTGETIESRAMLQVAVFSVDYVTQLSDATIERVFHSRIRVMQCSAYAERLLVRRLHSGLKR
jgi:hypothetical protein